MLNSDDGPDYEVDNHDGFIKVICHSRQKFYNWLFPVYWYEFIYKNINLDKILDNIGIYGNIIPPKFLRVATTRYYEYGGMHDEALKDLRKAGITNITYGEEL